MYYTHIKKKKNEKEKCMFACIQIRTLTHEKNKLTDISCISSALIVIRKILLKEKTIILVKILFNEWLDN